MNNTHAEATQPAAAQEAGVWSKTRPTAEGAYYVRGFYLSQLAHCKALVQVRMHHFDGEPAPELVCNLHESTSDDDPNSWSPIVDLAEEFEWLGPLYAAPVAAAPAEFAISDGDRAVLQRLKCALPTAGVNGWAKGVEVLERILRTTVASTPAAPGIDLQAPCTEAVYALARKLLWIAYVWNDHNFDHPYKIARALAQEFGIESFDQANAWLGEQAKLIDASPKGGSTDENNDLLPELRDVEDYFTSVDPNPIHLATVRQAISAIVGSPKGGSDALARAYGYLWHVNHPEDIPAGHPFMSADRAAVEARKELRDMLTHEQRGEGINWVRQKLLADMQATSAEVGA